LPIGAIIGIAVGGFVLFVGCLAAIVFFIYWKRQGLRFKPQVSKEDEEADAEEVALEVKTEGGETEEAPKKKKKKKKKKPKRESGSEGEKEEEGERWDKLNKIINN
jgi:uncharacterized membrane protein